MANALDAVLQMRREKIAREQTIAEGIASGVQSGIQNFQNSRKLNLLQDELLMNQANKDRAFELTKKTSEDKLALDREKFEFRKQNQDQDIFSQFKQVNQVADFAKTTNNPLLFAQAAAMGNNLLTNGKTDPNSFISQANQAQPNMTSATTGQPINSEQAAGIPADELDAFGEQTAQSKAQQEVAKQIAAQTGKEEAKQKVGASKGISGSVRFIEQFDRSVQELQDKGFEDFGETGAAGKVTRLGLSVMEKLDELPQTSALITEADVIANQTARDIEGGRVTDADRKIYSDALANTIARPSEENIQLTANALVRAVDKGGSITPILEAFADSNSSVIKEIVRRSLAGLTPKQRKELRENG